MNETLLSKTISYLRFPLIVGVVFIHSNMLVVNIQGTIIRYDKWPVVAFVMNLFSSVLADVCVPLFFFISGFLFFYNSDFSKDIYIKKVKKRIKTLFVPYIIWNFVAFLILLIQVHPKVVRFFPLLKDYNVDIVSFLSSFWITNLPIQMSGPANPINTPLWFVRDLMVLVLFSPVIWWLIKKTNFFLILLLGIVWFFVLGEYIGFPDLCHQSLFFFSLGSYFGIKRINFVDLVQKVSWVPVSYFLLALLDTILRCKNINNYVIHNVEILMGIIAFVSVVSYLLSKKMISVNPFLIGASFFVYVLHNLFLGKMTKIVVMTIVPESPILVLSIYFLMPLLAIMICLAIYSFLCRHFPTFCTMIVGGR